MPSRIITLAVALLPALAFGWGFDGHRRLAQNTHEPFSQDACLRAWLVQVTGQFNWQDKACDPDRWRQTDPQEAPRHYLNIDYASPIESYPREWDQVVARFGQYAEKNGTVAFRVEDLYAQLVADMKARDGAKALETVAYLSHYVTDAFSPMHDTKEQPGTLHLRYESDLLEPNAQIDAVTQQMRSFYGTLGQASPRHHIYDAVIAGQPLAQRIIRDDFANNGNNDALYQNTREITARRWGDALTFLASLVGTAWVEAGKPMLPGMPNGCSTDVPQGEVVLEGYAWPPPWSPDAGTDPTPDAGEPADAGHKPGQWDPLPLDAGTPGQQPPSSEGCSGCGNGPLVALLPLGFFGLVQLGRRRT